jgi:RNA ligase (TIGR02306 family)
MSIHRVDVVRVYPEPHPNADKMEIVKILGFTCCVGKGQFRPGDLAAYIQPDSVVDSTRPEFVFLAGHERIRVKRLRGIISMGLVIPAPPGAQAGDDVAEILGVTHYDPPLPITSGGEVERPPAGYRPNYDVENLRRFEELLQPGEFVIATEKIHGANGRFCFSEDRMYAGSRTEWKRYDARNIWWQALEQNSWLEQFCRAYPDLTVYGEVYGPVQNIRYGVENGRFRVAVFDLLRGTEWLSYDEACSFADQLELAPLVYRGPYDAEKLKELAEGPSLVTGANNIREGIVVKPERERTDPTIGRVQLKIISNTYLEKY